MSGLAGGSDGGEGRAGGRDGRHEEGRGAWIYGDDHGFDGLNGKGLWKVTWFGDKVPSCWGWAFFSWVWQRG